MLYKCIVYVQQPIIFKKHIEHINSHPKKLSGWGVASVILGVAVTI